MKKKHSLIHIENCQVKSLEKAQLLCKAIDTIEKECGIGVVRISVKDSFICPDIDLTILANSNEPMEKLLGGLFIKLDIMRYGKKSKYEKA